MHAVSEHYKHTQCCIWMQLQSLECGHSNKNMPPAQAVMSRLHAGIILHLRSHFTKHWPTIHTSKDAKPVAKKPAVVQWLTYTDGKVCIIPRKSCCPCKTQFVWWFGKTCWMLPGWILANSQKITKNLIFAKNCVFSASKMTWSCLGYFSTKSKLGKEPFC